MVMALFGVPSPAGSTVTCGNILYLLLFGWWLSLLYVLVAAGMFVTVVGVPYGEPQVGEALHRKGWGSNGSSGWIEKPNLWVLHGPLMVGGAHLLSLIELNYVSLQDGSAGTLLAISFGPLGK